MCTVGSCGPTSLEERLPRRVREPKRRVAWPWAVQSTDGHTEARTIGQVRRLGLSASRDWNGRGGGSTPDPACWFLGTRYPQSGTPWSVLPRDYGNLLKHGWGHDRPAGAGEGQVQVKVAPPSPQPRKAPAPLVLVSPVMKAGRGQP